MNRYTSPGLNLESVTISIMDNILKNTYKMFMITYNSCLRALICVGYKVIDFIPLVTLPFIKAHSGYRGNTIILQ